MSRLLVVVARGTCLEGKVADEAHESDGVRVFTLAGQEVARVRAEDRCVVRVLPEGGLPAPRPSVTVAGTG